MSLTKLELEKQNKDLRTQLKNQAIKQELARMEAQAEDKRRESVFKRQNEIILMLQKEIASLTAAEKRLKEETAALREMLEKDQDMMEKYRAMLKKDSQTSSKPPSTDGYRKPKVYSSRQKSGRKPGGQPGHKGHALKPLPNPTTIIDHRPPV